MDSVDFNKLLNEKCGIDSEGFDTIQVIGANNAQEAAHHLSQFKVNYDPNPIVIRKQDTRPPVEYKQKVYVRYLRPPTVPAPGPLIIKEQRAPAPRPMPPLIVRQRPVKPKTPPPLILREAPPAEVMRGAPRYIAQNGQAITREDYMRMAENGVQINDPNFQSTRNSAYMNNMNSSHNVRGAHHSFPNPIGANSNTPPQSDDELIRQFLASGNNSNGQGNGWAS